MSSSNLSTAEAKAKGLPGHDVYRCYSHLLYHSDINRDAGVRSLCREALKAFSDTVMIERRHALSEEQIARKIARKKWLHAGGLVAGLDPPSPATFAQLEWMNFENLKIAAGFELTLKAMLLEKNYIVLEIDDHDQAYEKLSKLQKQRPIEKAALFAIDGYRFDGQSNYLPGLRSTSLKFSTIVQKPHYRAALGLSPCDLDLINEFRNLRNQIHFPGDPIIIVDDPPKLRAITDFVVDFINQEIISRFNQLAAKHERWNGSELQPLS
jgi:hypothetical protein